ncbi:nuclear cap-binding protein subunit 1 [Cryptococcus neoformans C23]|uniref:Nuclear cap-binding protein subunit 1 n=1 Tax=Cryptococcus neoformans (strain H99 / ATCC 208821 / CBS 10515 / FGSC 9487) TaxID=235443 RepID=J9VFC5_CRYN9|nr:nuclear cap-binding protein subunit 1 [Cryptococcus neoformans var. grubii H99]AUB22537.1 nuclear cap-binding protein subunit 1 [Cryptococcus neoformans var. grubii]OWZ35660.1 nuclear cap-binding protein subunit 1 [Cryptococcus neoformans var. grubii AD2-60a]OWZ47578.1 nuclear cap-binding protein subunit 1 [Cryptococcus neoformans var. grubii C23]OXC86742.1 nuclear cap-binding protein subunit 1 [Cryptococcus neoformans var. grubii AD1-7a]AFR93047.2 nuclear cap-binding protein subunit 1 [Cry|eukprot:XP_012047119.1 nuclear cap-binding protein subunit 1 [Cryptococcus neoformans var. grubii H99]
MNGFGQMPMMPMGFPASPGFGVPGGNYGGRGRGRGRDERRGGGRGRGGHGGGRAPAPETSDNRLRKMVIKLGDDEDFDPIDDPPRLARVLKRGWREGTVGLLEGFRVSVTQQPHKHGYYVGLLVALSRQLEPEPVKKEEEEPTESETKAGDAEMKDEKPKVVEEPAYGKEVMDDLNRAFRGWVEQREWQNVRLCLQFFSLLVTAKVVAANSLLAVYENLLNVLDEVGGGGDRSERAVRAVGEGLIRSAHTLVETNAGEVEALISKIEGYIIGRRNEPKVLQDPLVPILPAGQERPTYSDNLDNLLAALRAFQASNWEPSAVLPAYLREIVPIPGPTAPVPYELQEVAMPPELYEVDSDELDVGEGQIGNFTFFADEVVPSPSTLDGWYLRSLVLDIINLYEVNRKECSRILLELRKFLPRDTFRPIVPLPEDASPPPSTWSLESLVISTLLGAMLTLPKSHHKLIYYGSVITELCKASPNTVAPPVGRSMRKIFSLLGTEGLDVEIARRVAEWFSVHLSNFGFQWMWKEWVPELQLPSSHPRRAFMRRVIELEVRLSYYDRILETLPEAMIAEGAGVISSEAPDPFWAYEKDDHPLHAEAAALLSQIRQKLPSTEIIKYITEMSNASSGPDEPLYPAIRQMAFETISHLGSRSFSHFLNATERYSDVLRFLTPDFASRRILLDAVNSYWRRSSEMRLVTLDKYLQYGILEGIDIIEWIFADDEAEGEEGDGWTDGDKWEVLSMCLEKHLGRVKAISRRLKVIEREDEAARARKAGEQLERGEDVNVEDDTNEDSRPETSKEARDAQTSLDIQSTRLEKVLLATFKHFIFALLPWTAEREDGIATSHEGLKGVLTLLDSDEEGLWGVRAKWGWYREFVRRYQAQLMPFSDLINTTVISKMSKSEEEGSAEARAEKMVKSVWEVIHL